MLPKRIPPYCYGHRLGRIRVLNDLRENELRIACPYSHKTDANRTLNVNACQCIDQLLVALVILVHRQLEPPEPDRGAVQQ